VIDPDDLLVGNLAAFYGEGRVNKPQLRSRRPRPSQEHRGRLRGPRGQGALQTFHYSISEVPNNPSFKTRKADGRVGFFNDLFRDSAVPRRRGVAALHHALAAREGDPNPEASAAQGVDRLTWSHRAGATAALRHAVLAEQGLGEGRNWTPSYPVPDRPRARTWRRTPGRPLQFIRWLSNDTGTAIGPSRAPETGQILDVDVVLTDGWIRHFGFQANEFPPQTGDGGMSGETLRWPTST
jgi:hypothetical protein